MPKNTNRSSKKLDFLSVDELPAKGSIEMKILGNTGTYEGDYGLKINFDVQIGSKKYRFGIKPKNPGLRIILDSLVSGKKIEVERAEYNGNEYVGVVGADEIFEKGDR